MGRTSTFRELKGLSGSRRIWRPARKPVSGQRDLTTEFSVMLKVTEEAYVTLEPIFVKYFISHESGDLNMTLKPQTVSQTV